MAGLKFIGGFEKIAVSKKLLQRAWNAAGMKALKEGGLPPGKFNGSKFQKLVGQRERFENAIRRKYRQGEK